VKQQEPSVYIELHDGESEPLFADDFGSGWCSRDEAIRRLELALSILKTDARWNDIKEQK
jgi:hypothetical protein